MELSAILYAPLDAQAKQHDRPRSKVQKRCTIAEHRPFLGNPELQTGFEAST